MAIRSNDPRKLRRFHHSLVVHIYIYIYTYTHMLLTLYIRITLFLMSRVYAPPGPSECGGTIHSFMKQNICIEVGIPNKS